MEIQTKAFLDLHTTTESEVGSSKRQGQNLSSSVGVVSSALWLTNTFPRQKPLNLLPKEETHGIRTLYHSRRCCNWHSKVLNTFSFFQVLVHKKEMYQHWEANSKTKVFCLGAQHHKVCLLFSVYAHAVTQKQHNVHHSNWHTLYCQNVHTCSFRV